MLMVLLIPLVLGLIVGAEFSGNTVSGVPVAIADYDNSQLSRDLVEKIRTNDMFNVTDYVMSSSDLEKLLDEGKVAAGIIIPPHFSGDLSMGEAPRILVFYDGAQMSMAGAAKGKIAETLGTIKSGYMMKVMAANFSLSPDEAMKYVQPIQHTTRILGNPEKNYSVFMLQGLLLNFTQVAVYIFGIELVRKNKTDIITLWKKGVFAGIIGAVSVALMISSQILLFNTPFRGSIAAAATMTVIYMIGIGNLGVAAMVKKGDRLEAVKGSSVIMLMMLLCGYTYPVLAMPETLQIITKFVPFTYYASPMRDISLLGSTFGQMLPNIACLIVFIAFSWINTALALRKSRRQKPNRGAATLEQRIDDGCADGCLG